MKHLAVVNDMSYHQRLYHFKDEIKAHAGERFEGIIISRSKHPIEKDVMVETAYKINEQAVEDIITSCTIGSGGDIAMGILLRDPETPLEDLFRLVSSKDSYTGEKFICIDLSE